MGQFIQHVGCEECGSSDANAIYEDGSSWCYSCHTYKWNKGETSVAKSIASAVRDQFEQLPTGGSLSEIKDGELLRKRVRNIMLKSLRTRMVILRIITILITTRMTLLWLIKYVK